LAARAVGADGMEELYQAMAPLCRNITHEEVGRSGAFLLSSASNGITGEILHVDAGSPCLIGAGVTIGHRAVLHGALIEDDVLIGIGAIVLNGARIGHDSIIGAGTLVTGRSVIPPRSMVLGVPGRVVRQLTEEEVQSIRASPNSYSTYENTDYGTIKGLDFTFAVRRTNNVMTNVNYTFSFANGTGSVANTQRNIAWTGADPSGNWDAASIAEKAYAEAGGQAGAAGEAGGAQPEGGGTAGKDDVVDAEFEEVKDKGRRAS